jgi:hypothetical protein
MKLITLLFTVGFYCCGLANKPLTDTSIVVPRCNDFIITGKGDNPEWQKAKWVTLNQIDKSAKQLESKIKILYSATGIYVLFNGKDEKITSPFDKDFDDLYKADVFEVFFHTDTSKPIYFEYEISPLDKELVLLISNHDKNFSRWMPWHYEDYKVVKKVSLTNKEMKNGAQIPEWSAELFFPNRLLSLLTNVPPKSGMRWNANFCRLDYDTGKMTKWSWSPIKLSFHEFEKYFAIQFE